MSETEDSKGFYSFHIDYAKVITTDDRCNHPYMDVYEKDYEMCAKCGSIREVIRTER